MTNQGLFDKYLLSRVDEKPLPSSAKFFVLRYDSEGKDREASQKALTVYADEIKESNPVLSEELLASIRFESI